MSLKKNIDDIKVVCKHCNREMILESCRNNVQGIFVCGWCMDHVVIHCLGDGNNNMEGGEDEK